MALNATDAFTNPRTAAPPPNPLKSGLYSIRDFVRKGQEKEYANTLFDLMTELSPKGILEECFAAEIMKSTWRLRRCRNIEFDLSESTGLDPLIDPQTAITQKTVDRSRAQSHYLLRRSISELSKLQTARTIRMQLDAGNEIPGLADLKQVLTTLKKMNVGNEPGEKDKETQKPTSSPGSDNFPANMDALLALSESQLAERFRETGFDSFCTPVGQVPDLPSSPTSFCNSEILPTPATPTTPTPAPEAGSFCKTAEPAPPTHNPNQAVSNKVPRNAACPCGSGVKFKRCCGNPATPAANIAPGKAA
jgi:hypothetical protein